MYLQMSTEFRFNVLQMVTDFRQQQKLSFCAENEICNTRIFRHTIRLYATRLYAYYMLQMAADFRQQQKLCVVLYGK